MKEPMKRFFSIEMITLGFVVAAIVFSFVALQVLEVCCTSKLEKRRDPSSFSW